MTIQIRLFGFEELDRALAELPKAVGKNTLRRALMQVAKPIAADAQARAPKETGRLKKKITVAPQLSRRHRGDTPIADAHVFVGATPSQVATAIEFGTKPRVTEAGKSTGEVPRQPFLTPAFEAGKRKAAEDLKNILWNEIDKSRKRLARRALRKRGG